jgi:septum formation protein
VPVVLASRSPQRRALLARLAPRFEVVESRVDESACGAGEPEALALDLARAKAEDVAARRPEALVVAADTLVECLGEVIGKPADRDDAVRILTLLSHNPHRVITGLCVAAPDGRRAEAVSVTHLRMKPMSRAEIARYVRREAVLERAGAYDIQEYDARIISLQGSRSSVIGLPLEDLRRILLSLYPGDAAT